MRHFMRGFLALNLGGQNEHENDTKLNSMSVLKKVILLASRSSIAPNNIIVEVLEERVQNDFKYATVI